MQLQLEKNETTTLGKNDEPRIVAFYLEIKLLKSLQLSYRSYLYGVSGI